MATIALEYNSRTKGIASFIDSLLQVSVTKKNKAPEYNAEFVKMIRERDMEQKQTLSVEEQRNLF